MSEANDAPKKKLTKCTTAAYCFFRTPLSPIDFTLRITARNTIWQDTLKMTASTQAMLVAGVKSLDFLLGFIVGKASDNCRTRWGRRKPFILLSFPFGLASFLLFCNAAYLFGQPPDENRPCIELMNATNANATYCPELKACLDDAIAAGTLWTPTNTSNGAGGPSRSLDTANQMAFFVVFYFGFVFLLWTCVQVPYDALGYELTDDYNERTTLFSIKVFFQFIGYILHPLAGLILASFLTDLLLITALRSIIFAILGGIAQAILLLTVRERIQEPSAPRTLASKSDTSGTAAEGGLAERLPVPAIPSARRALSNRPYMRYLAMKMPLTIFSLVPSNMVSFYIKYILALESWTFFESVVLLAALLGGVLSIPITVKLSQRLGKARALSYMLFFSGSLLLIYFVIPPSVYHANQWVLSLIVAFTIGLGTTLAFGLPDALLADIIDYDELRTGDRNEGVYTVVETNLQQSVEIAGGVIPLMVLGAVGFQPLGGCSCGCGIPCGTQEGAPYARWICPDNVGYSCTGEVESQLLYSTNPPVAPCAVQSDGVLWTIQLFMLGLPGLLGLLAGVFASRQLITPAIHKQIHDQLGEAATPGAPAGGRIDPFTREGLSMPENTADSLLLEHLAPGEIKLATPSSIRKLRLLIGGRLSVWVVLIAILIAVMGATAIEELVTIGCLLLMVLFVLVPWDGKRFWLVTTKGERLVHLNSSGTYESHVELHTGGHESTSSAPLTSEKI